MASPQSSGSLHIFVGIAASEGTLEQLLRAAVSHFGGALKADPRHTPAYLGTGKVAPDMDEEHLYSPVMNDITGDQEPFDELYQGKRAFTSVELTRWNQSVLNWVKSAPHFATSSRGGDRGDEIGSLMLLEGLAYPLWVLYSRRDNTSMRAEGMPPGRHYHAARLFGRATERRGTRENSVGLTWKHGKVWSRKTGSLSLYDEDMSAVLNLPLE